MLDDVRALLVLQDRDRRLLGIAKDLERLPQEEARTKTKMADDQGAVKKAHDAVTECDLRIKRVELDVGARKTSIARMKVQQFETRKNDEFQALGNEITRYEKDVDDLETKELELMEELDAARSLQKDAEAALAKTLSLVEENLKSIAERRTRLENEHHEVSGERSRLAENAPQDELPLYERLMKTKDGLALAPLNAGQCGGCHMKVIPSTVVKVNTAKELARCENCGRMLYPGDA
ncbi:MAG: C4-type zinc ribbon domain-containing protein [Verrucomicrobiota bacterium]